MALPAGYTDFYELILKINYNNSALLKGGVGSPQYAPPQAEQAGWTEAYQMIPLASPPAPGNEPLQAAYTLGQARAAVLGVNYYIKSATFHQASVFKSNWPIAFFPTKPQWDSLATGANYQNQLCSSPEETLMFRLEAGNLRRWEHQIRGIKDYVSDDTMSYFPATSFADPATYAITVPFDSPQTAIPIPGTGGLSPANLTITVDGNGGIIGNILVTDTPGQYPAGNPGTYWAYVYQNPMPKVLALAQITIDNAGHATAMSTNWNRGSGYQAGTAYIPVSNDCSPDGNTLYGLPNYLTPATYWNNFLSCLISYTQSGTTRRISQTLWTAPNQQPSFPSGLVSQIFGTPNKCNRAMIQRVGNRQTGQIRLTKPARVRRGI